MDCYELTDYEQANNMKKIDDLVKKEIKKQEKPKTKPEDIFVGLKKQQKKTRKNTSVRFCKKQVKDAYF